MKWDVVALLLILVTPQSWSLQVRQEITMAPGEMIVSFWVPGPLDRNITLTWPIQEELLLSLSGPEPQGTFEFVTADQLSMTAPAGGGQGVTALFRIRHSQVPGIEQAFPVPSCQDEEIIISMQVVLPPGLVASDCWPECLKSYDHDVGALRLSWPRLDDQGCRATLIEPGRGEDGLAVEARRILLRSYLFWTVCLAVSASAAFAGFRLLCPAR